MLRTLVIIGLLAITPFAIGCSSEDGDGGSGGSGATGGSGGTGGSAGAGGGEGGGGGDGGSAGSGGSGVTVLPDGGTCDGTNTPCEIGCLETNCPQECDGDLNTGGTIQVVCSASCPGGGCNQKCEDGATCTFTCEGGTCAQVCDEAGGSTCDFSCTPDNNCT